MFLKDSLTLWGYALSHNRQVTGSLPVEKFREAESGRGRELLKLQDEPRRRHHLVLSTLLLWKGPIRL